MPPLRQLVDAQRNPKFLVFCVYMVNHHSMSRVKSILLKGKRLAGKISGTPWLSWTPSMPEQVRAEQLLEFLNDRRALYQPYDREIDYFVRDSMFKLRERLTKE